MAKFILPINLILKGTDLKRPFVIDVFKLRKITADELKKFYGISKVEFDASGNVVSFSGQGLSEHRSIASVNLSQLEMYKLYGSRYVIEFNEDVKIINQKIVNLLLSFKLFKSQSFFAPIILSADTNSASVVKLQSTYKTKATYELTKKELLEVKKVYNIITNQEHNSKINLQLERYNYSIGGEISEKNSFVELVSILESLFLDENNNELSFRFSLIVSFIINNPKKSEYDFSWAKTIYQTRSDLIHRGQSKKFNLDLYNSLKTCTGKLIIWHLKNNKNYKEIEEKIFNTLKIS